ncbi:hypothetical protein QYF36_023078 [Acer negundo]|nr:hypothetical protein QYF36_023078 [Acer negundo]
MSFWNGDKSLSSVLKWIDIFGVPLIYWCKSFFKKLGGQVGELVWIEEDTEFRGRFDKGRILILGSQFSRIETVVNVRVRNTIFLVRLVESSDPVSKNWVDEILALRPGIFQNQKTEEGKGSQDVRSQFIGDSWLEKKPKSSKRKKDSRTCFPILNPREICEKSWFFGKGKSWWVQKLKVNHRRSGIGTGCNRIGKSQMSN